MDRFLLLEELKSHKVLILLQAYSMIIHVNFMYFLYEQLNYIFLSGSVVAFVLILQCMLVAIILRIIHKYQSSANALFYVNATIMIVKILADHIFQNYQIYKNNKGFCFQSQYFSNQFVNISLCLFVICVLNGGVAYASDEEVASLLKGGSIGRYARSGISFATVAGGYEVVFARVACKYRSDRVQRESVYVYNN